MSLIRILSDHLANQIAAGEVVERPASVVKELLENSLDAGCTKVDIQVEGAGTRLLRVMDNGIGMDEDDVLLCLERHATSKLQNEGQLGAIATLGFRGEAIPSIASVSRFTILSRVAQNSTGTRAEIRYGTLHAIHEDGCSKGTLVEVKNLFGNIPARKKFLKTARTELLHIEEVVKNQALANPEVAFSLQVDGRQSLKYLSVTDLEERVRAVFRYQGTLLELNGTGGENESSNISGFLQLPESVSASTARLRILVNGRPVQDRTTRHAVAEGLHGFLMKGNRPAGVLVLELSPAELDVNVHPAKHEIRFRNAGDVHQFVTGTVRKAVQNYQEQVRSELFVSPSIHKPALEAEKSFSLPSFTQQDIPVREASISAPRRSGQAVSSGILEIREPDLPSESTPASTTAPTGEVAVVQESLTGLTLIGQLFELYLLCEKNGRLLVIDQHAAHERILFGRMRQAYLEQKVPSQNLLFPVTVELGSDHCELFERHQQAVEQLGLQAAHFGDVTYVIKAVPALISRLAPVDILIETLDALRNTSLTEGGGIPTAIDRLFASMSCKAAIKAGNRLQPEEMIELLLQMEASEVFSHCPHGRPVIKYFSQTEIEKWFHRT